MKTLYKVLEIGLLPINVIFIMYADERSQSGVGKIFPIHYKECSLVLV